MAVVILTRRNGPPYFADGGTVPDLLESAARTKPDHVVLRHDNRDLTYAGLDEAVNRAANGLSGLGIKRDNRVAVMLGHHVDHVIVFFALMKLGAVLVPMNVGLKGASLEYQLTHSDPALIIADGEFADAFPSPNSAGERPRFLWRNRPGAAADQNLAAILATQDTSRPAQAHAWDDLRIILYTSGTTGPPKGVQMSDRMVQASALGSIWLSEVGPGSVLHFWDPIYHVFGAEVLVLSLMVPVTLHMVPKFSASQFWHEVREAGASHVHFVGGVLQLLLKQPPSPLDRTHGGRIAWGGGCPKEVWRTFEERFGMRIREGYGMTETSSFSTINPEERFGSIGRAVDYFAVEVVNAEGRVCSPGAPGEIRVSAREPGVLTSGYYNNPEATSAALRNGWLYTGDLGSTDSDGFVYYLGRKRDSLRRRGENISAWEVERVINEHPEVAECALISVKTGLGDEDLKLFVLRAEGSRLGGADLIAWCGSLMPKYQIPRFVQFVDGFQKTPTQRIQKQFLSVRPQDSDYDVETDRLVRKGDAP